MNNLNDYITDLLKRIGYIESFTHEGLEAFMQDIKTQEAVIRSYEVIGEIVKRLPQPLLDEYPEAEWKKIKAFRDYLIHNYNLVDLEYVWEAVRKLPTLKAAVQAMQRKFEDISPPSPEN